MICVSHVRDLFFFFFLMSYVFSQLILVEDFTGRGLFILVFFIWCYICFQGMTLRITGIDDLKSRRIATPLPALVSFMADPLRVLRAIRFGNLSFSFSFSKGRP